MGVYVCTYVHYVCNGHYGIAIDGDLCPYDKSSENTFTQQTASDNTSGSQDVNQV